MPMSVNTSDISPSAGIVSKELKNVVSALEQRWMKTLSPSDRQIISEISKIANSSSIEQERYDSYQQYLEVRPSIMDRINAATLVHKWADVVRQSYEFAHRRGVNQRMGEEKKAPGQTVMGALERTLELLTISQPETTQAEKLKAFENIVSGISFWVQSTAHPTPTTGNEYQGANQSLRRGFGAYAINDNDITKLDQGFQEITNTESVIRLEKRTAPEEIEESFIYAANGMMGSAHAAYKLRELMRDAMSGHPGLYRTQPISFYMNSEMGGWEMGDADGNPARRAEYMRQGIEGDFEKIRQRIISELQELKDRTTIKPPLDRAIDCLACAPDLPHALSYQNDPSGKKLSKVLQTLSTTQIHGPEVRVRLQELAAVMDKAGWFWRRGDMRQSSEIHTGICDLIENGMDWDQLKTKIENLRDGAADAKIKKEYGVYWETLARLDVYKEYPDAMRQYIISNYSGVQDAKNLWSIMKLAGVNNGLQLCFLHETAADLIAAPKYLRAFCEAPEFTDYLEQNNHRLTIKIALSDTQRESGPATYFLQMQAPVNCMLELMAVNRERVARGLPTIKMDLQYGGSDDLVRGGNDNANYLQEFVRNLKGAASLNGYTESEIRTAMGSNFNATNQGRQRVATLGDRYSAERTMERHAAQAIGAAAFLQHDHRPDELQAFQREYQANIHARDLIYEPLIGYYKAYRGAMRNKMGDTLTSMSEASKQNDGSRPDTRPGAKQDWTETRAITNDFADQLGGLRLTGWLGLHRLYANDIEELHSLYQSAPQFRDWCFRAQMILENVEPMDAWRRSGHPELRPCCFTHMEKYYQAIESQLVERAKGGIQTPKMTEVELDVIYANAMAATGTEDTPENRIMLCLSHAEFAMRKSAGITQYIMTGRDFDVRASATNLMQSFPSQNGDGITYDSNAPARISAEIEQLKQIREFGQAILSMPEMIANRSQYHERPEGWTKIDELEKTAGSIILTCNQTPSAYLDSSAAVDELHLAQAKPAILPTSLGIKGKLQSSSNFLILQ